MVKSIILKDCLLSEECGVYLIRNNDTSLIKIGKANNLRKRFKEIQSSFKFCGSVPNLTVECFLVSDEPLVVEKRLHEYFKEYKYTNEWFDISDFKSIVNIVLELYLNNNNNNNNAFSEQKGKSTSLNIFNKIPFIREHNGDVVNFYEFKNGSIVSNSIYGIPTIREFSVLSSLLFMYTNNIKSDGTLELNTNKLLNNMGYTNNPSNTTRNNLKISIDILSNTDITFNGTTFNIFKVEDSGLIKFSDFIITEINSCRYFNYKWTNKNFLHKRISCLLNNNLSSNEDILRIIPSISLSEKYNKRDVLNKINEIKITL